MLPLLRCVNVFLSGYCLDLFSLEPGEDEVLMEPGAQGEIHTKHIFLTQHTTAPLLRAHKCVITHPEYNEVKDCALVSTHFLGA